VRHADAPSSPAHDGSSGYRVSEFDQSTASYRQAEYGSGGRDAAWADDLRGGGYSWLSDDYSAGSPGYAPPVANAIRGLPPVPDEPLPVYPPGPFAAWNRGGPDRGDSQRSAANASAELFEPPNHSGRAATRGDSARMLATATITPDEFDTNHSLPAIKDPVLTKERSANGVGDRGSATGSRSATRSRATQSRAAAPARARPPAGGSSRRKSTRPSKGSKRQPVRLAIGVAAAIIAAVAVILVITSIIKPGSNSGASDQTNRSRSSTSPTPTRPPGKWEFIGTRQTDPSPLQLSELFPYRFVAGGVFYYSTITRLGGNCRAALVGSALRAAVRHARCTQVLRATYFSRPQNVMATIGVFNLATSAGARAAALKAGPAEFVAVLPGKKGATSKIGQGSGIEEAVVKGHYLVLVWAENVNLSTPATRAARRRLTGFANTVIHGTVNNGLSYRMVDGKPAPPVPGQ
jgi:hypothetical protein